MKQNGILQIVKKIGIILGVVVIVFLALNFIPAKVATDKNDFLEKNDILIMAEKGGYTLNPANTRKAFDKVIKSSSYSDIVELDVRLSKDEVLMIWEDETINKAALKEDAEVVKVSEKTSEELKKYNLGNNFVSTTGSKPYENITSYVSQGLSMMTFDEFVFRYNSSRSSVYYMVDIQETGERGCLAVDKVAEVFKEEDYEKFKTRVILSTNDKEVRKYIEDKYSDYLVCGQGNDAKKLVTVSKLGYQFLYNAKYELVQVDMRNKGIVGINYNVAKKSFIRKIEARNMVAIYTNVVSASDIEILYEIGAHVIGTSNPEFVDKTIKELEKKADK